MTAIAQATSPRIGLGRETVLLVFSLSAILGIATAIEITGGFPSQLAHLYYIPVVFSALTLNRRFSLGLVILACLFVSPVIDIFTSLAGQERYFSNPSPFNLAPSGWILRPVAFLTISQIISFLIVRHAQHIEVGIRSEALGGELNALSQIEKMILAGAGEDQSISEVARFVLEFTDAHLAGIVMPSPTNKRENVFRGYFRGATEMHVEEHLPSGEGVTGWAIVRGKSAWTRDAYNDSRYQDLVEIAKQDGWRSAAAAPIILDGEILGALTVGFAEPRDFMPDEIAALERLADQAAIAVTNARQREALTNLALDTATVLSSVIESRDAYTGDHCVRLVDHAGLTAEAFGLTGTALEVIKLGAALHDVGKIAVPDHVLKKPDRLTPEEYAIIKQHCYVGGQICKKVPFLENVYPLVYHHHEHFDGHGYPDGLAGERIPFGARIIAVVDAYDAMTTDRPYRSSIGHNEAVRILTDGAGEQWDPQVVERFLGLMVGSNIHRLAA